MSIQFEIEDEIAKLAANQSLRMILMFIDKLESKQIMDVKAALTAYIACKMQLHKLCKAYNEDYYYYSDNRNSSFILNEEEYNSLVTKITSKVKYLRRNYYAARRYETKCNDLCTCRGCKYLKEFSANS